MASTRVPYQLSNKVADSAPVRWFRRKSLSSRSISLIAVAFIMFASVWYALPAKAAIAHKATSTAENGAGAGTITISPPSGTVYGDLLVLALSTRDGSGFTATPSGWTQRVVSGLGSPALDLYVYTKVAGSGESNLTITLASSSKAAAVMSAYTGVDIYDPVDVTNTSNNSTASTTYSVGTMTTTQPNTMLVAAFGAAGSGTVTAGSSMTLTGQATSSGGGSGATKVTLGMQAVAQAAAGATGAKTMTGPSASNIGFLLALRPAVNVEQASYRFFQNADSTSVTTPLAAIDTPITVETGAPFRLRLNLGIPSGGANATNVAARTFRLQYSTITDGTCDAGFSGESYADVGSATEVKFYDNTTPTNGAIYSANATYDPKRTSITAISQKYHESNPLSMNAAIAPGEDGLWDFALTTTSYSYGKVYCLRVQEGTVNSSIATYTQIPKITIATPTVAQANYRWFANADSVTPGSALAAQDTAATIAPQTPVRLRQRLAVNVNQATASYQNYKLQYAEKTGACSGLSYIDVTPTPISQSQTKNAGTVTSVNHGGATLGPWSNPSNATGASNSISAQVSTTGVDMLSQSLDATNFGFTLPSNGTPAGITVDADRSSSHTALGSYVDEAGANIIRGGSLQGTNRARPSTAWYNPSGPWGGASDLWDMTSLTYSEVNASDFGASIQVGLSGASIEPSSASVDSISITVTYTTPGSPGAISYNDNTSPVDAATIASSGSDPANSGRTTVYQNYRETDPFTNDVAAIPAGQDGLWDFSLTTTNAVAGKTYCFRVVKSNGATIDSYSQYAEITFSGGGGGGPTPTAQKLRGGRSIQNGVKSGFEL